MESTDLEFDFVPDAIPFLEEWKIEREVEMPFSAALEMVFAALQERASPDKLPTLTDVLFHRPIIRGNGRLVHLQVAPRNRRFQIVSRGLDRPTEQGIRHISGRFRVETNSRVIEESQQNPDYRSYPTLNRDTIYRQLEDSGFFCGPSFRVVDQLWLLPDGAIGRIGLPKWLKVDLELYLVHPVLLGSALQLVSLATRERNRTSGLHFDLTHPARIGSLSVLQPSFENAWIEARIRESEADRDTTTHFDLFFRDANGALLAIITDMSLTSCPPSKPQFELKSLTEDDVIRLIDEVVLLDELTADANLFSVGATSVDIIRIVNALESRYGVRIEFEAVLAKSTVKGIVDWYRSHWQQLTKADASPSSPTARTAPESRYPLSHSQEQLWFIEQFANTNQAYNEPIVYRLTGEIDLSALENALSDLVERHEILRTVFRECEGQLYQVVRPLAPLRLSLIVLDAISRVDRVSQAHTIAVTECRKPFDLSAGPLLRSHLIRLDRSDHLLVIVAHHIIVDAWSLARVFLPELSLAYRARIRGSVPDFTPLQFQYKDYALYTRSPSSTTAIRHALSFWSGQLRGVPHLIQISSDRARPLVQTHQGARHVFSISRAKLQSLQNVAQKRETTLHVVLLSGFAILISRLSALEDFCIGIPTINRSHQSWESVLGCFVDMIPFRAKLDGNPSIGECIERAHRTLMGVLTRHQPPLSKIAAELKVSHSQAYSLLVQYCFIYDSLTVGSLSLEGLSATTVAVDPGTSKFDLSLRLLALPDQIEGSVEYNTDIFQRDTIERVADRYLNILDAFSASTDTCYKEVVILPEYERQLVLNDWSKGRSVAIEDLPVHRLFERQVDRTPEAPAVSFCGDTLSFIELERRANRVARFLQAAGVSPGDRVAIDTQPSIDRIVGMLSILKTGAGYVPLDRSNPDSRLSFIVSDSQAKVLLCQKQKFAPLLETGVKTVFIEDIVGQGDRSTDDRLDHIFDSRFPVYVIYTSGSTGTPKGVVMHHPPLVNLILWQNRCSQMGLGSRTLQFSSFGFDVSFQEIMSTLTTGGHLFILPQEYKANGFEVLRYIDDHAIERIFIPFIALQQLAIAAIESNIVPSCLREIITAGEQLQINPTIVRFFRSLKGCKLINQYGPSETHVTTQYRLSRQPEGWPTLPPIGRPIDNVEIVVLDRNMNPVAIGEVGELYLGGLCVSQGYINDSKQTDERFLSLTIDSRNTSRFYRTGDLSRFRNDGEIEFVGRIDNQIKIRGYRIEPGEVESAISSLVGVEQVAVLGKEYGPTDKRLVAYLLRPKTGNLTPSMIRSHLSNRLPDYMIPASFVFVDELPLTASGKVNRLALADRAPPVSDVAETIVPARTQLEKQLVQIWNETLKIRSIGIRDDFFKSGGNSLLLMQLLFAIRVRTGLSVTIAELLTFSTIEKLASYFTERDGQLPSDRKSVTKPINDKLLICLKRGVSAEPPIFFLHPMSGTALAYQYLASRMNTRAAIYGIQNHPIEGRGWKRATLEQMAEAYINTIFEKGFHQLNLVVLVGHSIGGAIAYEMACQLSERGLPIGLLALLDTTIGWQMPPTLCDTDRLALVLGDRLGMSLEGFRNLTSDEQLSYVARVLFDTSRFPMERARFECAAMLDTARANENALRHYRPRPYTGSLLYIRAKERLDGSTPNPENPWFELTGGRGNLTVVSGNHVTMLTPPDVQETAAELNKAVSTSNQNTSNF